MSYRQPPLSHVSSGLSVVWLSGESQYHTCIITPQANLLHTNINDNISQQTASHYLLEIENFGSGYYGKQTYTQSEV